MGRTTTPTHSPLKPTIMTPGTLGGDRESVAMSKAVSRVPGVGLVSTVSQQCSPQTASSVLVWAFGPLQMRRLPLASKFRSRGSSAAGPQRTHAPILEGMSAKRTPTCSKRWSHPVARRNSGGAKNSVGFVANTMLCRERHQARLAPVPGRVRRRLDRSQRTRTGDGGATKSDGRGACSSTSSAG